MGMNYFAVLSPTEDYKTNLNDVLDNIKHELLHHGKLHWETQERLDNLNRTIHIGKSSVGWQFLWEHHNGKYYDVTLDSIKEFLSNCTIIDEEYRELTADEFFEEIGCKLYKSDKYCNIELYHKKYPEEYKYYVGHDNEIIVRGKTYKTNEYPEFENDGLRFAGNGDFS